MNFVLFPGKSHGWRSLEGCSPWVAESGTTEQLHFQFSLSCIGEGNGNPLQCFWLENPRDRGTWWAAVYGVAQGQTQLKWLSSSSSMSSMKRDSFISSFFWLFPSVFIFVISILLFSRSWIWICFWKILRGTTNLDALYIKSRAEVSWVKWSCNFEMQIRMRAYQLQPLISESILPPRPYLLSALRQLPSEPPTMS